MCRVGRRNHMSRCVSLRGMLAEEVGFEPTVLLAHAISSRAH